MSETFAEGLVGVVLDGRYRLDAVLGEGGMGAVYRAHHLAMERRVAVKLLKPHLTSDDAALQRFAREARSTMKVDSPHAVKLLDFGITPGRDYYMVLEYLDGRTVQRELDVDGPFAPARVVHIAQQALAALGAAHRSGLVHRDIKPDNLLVMKVGDDADYTKVLDFGVAKLMEGAARSTRSALAITQAGTVFGTPEFMSPEQACGQTVDPRSDLYSLAATMFAMLTGRGMYRAGSALEWLTHHVRTPPPHLWDGAGELVPYTALDAVLQRCLAKRRDERPASAEEMSRLLAQAGTGLGPRASGLGQKATTGELNPGVSTYVEALPEATLVPSAEPTTTGVIAASRSRGRWIALGALAIVGMISATIVVATRGRDQKRAAAMPAVAKQAEAQTDAGIADRSMAVVVDAQPAVAVRPVSAPGLKPEVRSPKPSDPAVPAPGLKPEARSLKPSAEAAAHLAAAEEAARAGNRLRQIAEADATLHTDPHNVRARYLLADGLIGSGDLDRGCRYLRDLGRAPIAVARARQAGCPSD